MTSSLSVGITGKQTMANGPFLPFKVPKAKGWFTDEK